MCWYTPAIVLCAPYAMSGADVGVAAIRRACCTWATSSSALRKTETVLPLLSCRTLPLYCAALPLKHLLLSRVDVRYCWSGIVQPHLSSHAFLLCRPSHLTSATGCWVLASGSPALTARVLRPGTIEEGMESKACEVLGALAPNGSMCLLMHDTPACAICEATV